MKAPEAMRFVADKLIGENNRVKAEDVAVVLYQELRDVLVEVEKERTVFFTKDSIYSVDHDLKVRKQMRKEIADAIRERLGIKEVV